MTEIGAWRHMPSRRCSRWIPLKLSDANSRLIHPHPQTGNEASVDRLMKQISGFMTDITDEFKIIVVEAIRSLCLKFPSKQAVMLGFLSGVLRDEGGYDFKRAVVEAIFDMIKYIKECKETGQSCIIPFTTDASVIDNVSSSSSSRASLRIHRGLRIH